MNDNDLRAIALRYFDAGWHPLPLPAGKKEKPPAGTTGGEGPDWTREQITGCEWSGNICLRMPEGVVGLDYDAYHEDKGRTLEEMQDEYGPLPSTQMASNGRTDGSGTRFFRVPVGLAWPGSVERIDVIRRGHRYQCVWPSLHEEGRTYVWIDQTDLFTEDPTAIPDIDVLPDLPDSWVQAITQGRTQSSGSASTRHHGSGAPGQAQLDLAEHLEQKHGAHSRYVMRDGRIELTRPGKESRDGSSVSVIVGSKGDAVATVFTSGWEGLAEGSYVLIDGELFDVRDSQLVDGVLFRSTAPPVIVGLSPVASTPDDDAEFLLEFLDDLSVQHDPQDDLVEGLVIPGRWLNLASPAKVGKSSLALFMAIELSEGRDPFDGTQRDPVPVLWCNGEMGQLDLIELLDACGHDPLALARFHSRTKPLRLDTPDGAAALCRTADVLGVKLVVFDGLNGFVEPGADENSSSTWAPFFDFGVRPLKERGIAVVSLDNTGHENQTRSRGSAVKLDKADATAILTRTDAGVRVTVGRGRGSAYVEDTLLDAEGLDRTRPIRYKRASGGWPAGTSGAAQALDALGLPVDVSRNKARLALKAKRDELVSQDQDPTPFQVRNEVLGAAVRFRRNPLGTSLQSRGPLRGPPVFGSVGTTPGTSDESAP